MKQVAIVNAVNIMLLIPIVIVYIILGMPLWYIAVYAIWFLYMIIINAYMILSNDIKTMLRRADKHNLFTREVGNIIRAADSIAFYSDIFGKYDEGNPIRKTYDMLRQKSDSNIQKAVKWLSQYNKISNPSSKYIQDLSENSLQIMHKLDELNELTLQIEDSATNVDISYVDDLLKSLKEIIDDEQ